MLITGDLDLKEPEYGTVDLGHLIVHAAGSVTARTWRVLEETIQAPGRTPTRWSWDRMTAVGTVSLPVTSMTSRNLDRKLTAKKQNASPAKKPQRRSTIRSRRGIYEVRR